MPPSHRPDPPPKVRHGVSLPSSDARASVALDAQDWALLAAARGASLRAYAPYSKVRVGAALLDVQGGVHLGCNVENVSFGMTLCAERTAVVRAVADGVREFRALAIHATTPAAFAPCGACRQVLGEFAPELRVLWQGADLEPRVATLRELMGAMLRPEDLGGTADGAWRGGEE